MHRPYSVRTPRRLVINAGSATDLHVLDCGYHVYEVDPARFTVRVARREWSQTAGAYLDAPRSPLAQTFTTRG
jgi:hypothetical protein